MFKNVCSCVCNVCAVWACKAVCMCVCRMREELTMEKEVAVAVAPVRNERPRGGAMVWEGRRLWDERDEWGSGGLWVLGVGDCDEVEVVELGGRRQEQERTTEVILWGRETSANLNWVIYNLTRYCIYLPLALVHYSFLSHSFLQSLNTSLTHVQCTCRIVVGYVISYIFKQIIDILFLTFQLQCLFTVDIFTMDFNLKWHQLL